MAWQDVAAKVVQGIAGAAGNTDAQNEVSQWQQQRQQQRQQQLQLQLTPLQEALRADQTRLALYANPDDPSKPLPGKEAEYNATHDRMANTIGQIRQLYGQKPQGANPIEAGMGNLLDKLHITNHLKNHVAAVRAANAAKYAGQNEAQASEYGAGALPFAMTPEGQQAAYARQTQEELQRLRNEGGATSYKNFKLPDGKVVSIDTRHQTPPPGAVLVGTSTGYIRQGSHVLLPSSAISLMRDVGQTFPKQDGGVWTEGEISKFPKGIILAQFIEGDKTFYAPLDQRTKTATWGNVVHQINEAGEITPATETALGPQRVGTVTTQTAPGGGQVVTQTSTPITSGTTGASPSVHPSTPSGPRHTKLQGRADVERGKSILPDIQNMTPRNAEMARKAQPAVTALLGLYGDPQNPEAPSMVEFAPLANDPHAQQVLGEAFKLLDQSMGEISDPGIIQTLGTAAGWANFRAQAEAGAQQATGMQMTPQEREYFDAAIASMADIIGSRSATGQSPARFSVRSIQNELPLIGLSGTPDETSYLTKMQTIGRQVRVGLNAMPDNARALAWLDKREEAIAQQKENKPSKKPIVQYSASTDQYRYSTDGGRTWHQGKPPKQ